MKAGREMDALIALEVMGWSLVEGNNEEGEDFTTVLDATGEQVGWQWGEITPADLDDLVSDLPHYSTDIADAWTVVEQFDTCELQRWRQTHRTDLPEFFWSVSLTKYTPEQYVPPTDGATVAEAICRAALAAVQGA